MPYFEIDSGIDVDPDEYIDSCSRREILELKKLVQRIEDSTLDGVGIREDEFREAIVQLQLNYYRLSEDDIDEIIKISNKL